MKKTNKLLIKRFIKYKLNTADAILECIPSNKAEKVKSFSRIILEALNEYADTSAEKEQSSNKSIEIH